MDVGVEGGVIGERRERIEGVLVELGGSGVGGVGASRGTGGSLAKVMKGV